MWPEVTVSEALGVFSVFSAAISMLAVGIVAGQLADLGPEMSKRDFRIYMAGLACCVVAMWLFVGLFAYLGVL